MPQKFTIYSFDLKWILGFLCQTALNVMSTKPPPFGAPTTRTVLQGMQQYVAK